MHFGGWQTTGKLFLALPSNLPNVSIQYLLDCCGVHKLKSGRVLILVLTVVASSSLLGFRDWTTASSSAASHSSSSTCQTAGADRLSSPLAESGSRAAASNATCAAGQLDATWDHSRVRAPFALHDRCSSGTRLRGGRPGASARLDPPLLSGRVRRGLVCPRRRRSPGSGPGASCEGNVMRVRLRAASSVRFIRMITATGCGGRFLLREDCHRWLASGDLCCYELHTEHKRPVLLVYEQFVRCIYDYTCPNIIRGVNTVVTDRLYSFGFEVFLS